MAPPMDRFLAIQFGREADFTPFQTWMYGKTNDNPAVSQQVVTATIGVRLPLGNPKLSRRGPTRCLRVKSFNLLA